MAYTLQVFRKRDNKQFHDQRGYLIYDKKKQIVYDSFCIPRAVCVVAEGKAGNKMTLTSQSKGIAESQYMAKNDATSVFSITFDLTGDTLRYLQKTQLHVYGKSFTHVESSALSKASSQRSLRRALAHTRARRCISNTLRPSLRTTR
ncbi:MULTISPECIES: FABP family protein [Paraburkholderia]|uniref:FABP family protein n=1 Tax=Paraburkholderia TaxID=1822464 RepID=UPI00037A1389|nr:MULTISPECIES: heme-binding beta-barrel domain-containing protein [Paraburkholderia]MDH6153395.1 hypothetical protein [Paraburkholderia sp. WSM4179]